MFGETATSTGQLIVPGGVVQVLGDHVGLFDNALIDVFSPNGEVILTVPAPTVTPRILR